ncbi:copper resistance protein NlpE N-terminal domain-containing protein [Campylobacter sp. faydin G-140]|uniref:copper resistance protein NlpE N-terminal domain-containing protein n=1 Tax=Campylobacter anatolicus TaxID=2829105 RepID=UPI001B981A1D|nr:copper resistance protein NlpE N-terminal domain-containing protein [Campylobacter anatolicus]MBR8464933.1 copper resistance protein NlpE N-terminal domain-containing protein [Campylobacter anatolicus]
MRVILAVLLTMFLTGCMQHVTQKSTKFIEQNKSITKQKIQNKIVNTNNILHSYHSILPCNKCDGIKTIITLNKDKTYTKTMLSLSKTHEFITENGAFKIDNDVINLIDNNNKSSYFKFNKNSLLQLDDSRQKRTGALAEIYKFDMIKASYKDDFLGEFVKFKDKNNFLSVVIVPFKDGINLKAYSNLNKKGEIECEFEGEFGYKNGIYYLKNTKEQVSLHRLKDEIFINADKTICKNSISGRYRHKSSMKNLFGKNFISNLTSDMKNADIVRIYGAKNIKRNTNEKKKESFYVLDDSKKPLFKYTLTNGIITQIEVISDKFKTPNGIKIGSSFKDIKTNLKVQSAVFDKNNNVISLKIPSENMLIRLKNNNKKNIKSIKDIDENAKCEQILLLWNE